MILAQVGEPTGVSNILFFGTLGMFIIGILIILFIIVHQRKVIKDQFRRIKLLVTKVKELEAQLTGSGANDIKA